MAGQTPEERLQRLIRTSRRGWSAVCADDAPRQAAVTWLAAHPSPNPAIDRMWRECLLGSNALADWLSSTDRPETWELADPTLRSVLASHPFAGLPRWSTRKT